jgi:asparagine synthetase B (glutamine-hydrolysing)
MTGFRWLLVSTRSIPGFEAALVPEASARARVYAVGRVDALAGCGLTVSTPPVPDRSPGADTLLAIGADSVLVRVSRQNTTPVYFAADPAGGHFLVGDDLPVVAAALAAVTGTPAVLRQRTTIRPGTESAVHGVHRLEHGTDLTLRRTGGEWHCEQVRRPGDVLDVPVRHRDPLEAGRAQIDALRSAVRAAVADEPAAGVLVSGGVDSGVVAATLAETAVPATAYSVGTEWGDEFDQARATADATGLALRRVRLSTADITSALPATVRAFGHGDPEAIAIGVALTAFCRGTHARERVLFTGYGSDLVNSGMATTDEIDDDIGARVREAVHRTRYSGEFTSAAAVRYGHRLVHPYWHPGVLEVALGTDPAAKAFRDREKGHLRLAAAELLPDVVAWQRKTAIHHGNGIGANLGRLLDEHTGRAGSAAEVYRAMLGEQIAMAAEDPLVRPSGPLIYERAVAAVARAHDHTPPMVRGGVR